MFGHIIRWREAGSDPGATRFQWDVFVLAGDPSNPDPAKRGTIKGDMETAEALTNVPFIHKNLGVFDLDRPAQSRRAVEQLTNYADLLSRLTVVEVTGAPDFEGLVEVMGDLLGWRAGGSLD